jgi:hypothetical protein
MLLPIFKRNKPPLSPATYDETAGRNLETPLFESFLEGDETLPHDNRLARDPVGDCPGRDPPLGARLSRESLSVIDSTKTPSW